MNEKKMVPKKTRDKVFINIYTDPSFKQMFKDAAAAEGLSVSELGNRFLRAAFKARYSKVGVRKKR